jgi:branched-chain amino acid transport system ATP-binding protein
VARPDRAASAVTALEIEGLSRNFGGVRALEDVTITLRSGERRVIIGTNGAGKTTLFNVLNGQIAADSGRIRLYGRDVTRLSTHRRAALGLARTFQITSLFPGLTVHENMVIAAQALASCRFVFYRRVGAFGEVLARAQELLQRFALWDARDELVRNLSYGMQRQIEIALALAGEPKLLLLDEPTAGLSASETHLATEMIEALDRSITILAIEHDLAVAFRLADRITAMDRGRVVAEGTADEIRAEPQLKAIYSRGGAADA